MRMSRWDVKVADIPIGDPFNPPGSSKIQNDPFTIAAITLATLGAYGTHEAGQAQKQQYNMQARMATIRGEREAIQNQQKANMIRNRLQRTNATLAARAYAGGVDPFSGSPDVIRALNETDAGREYSNAMADARAALSGGLLQAQLYRSAGKQAARQANFNAAMQLGQAALSAAKPSPGTQSPAPIETRQVPSYQP
jgi:hypothetical protein